MNFYELASSLPVRRRNASRHLLNSFRALHSANAEQGEFCPSRASRGNRARIAFEARRALPDPYPSAGQKREESGVRHSSIKSTSLSTVPNSNFVSATMIPHGPRERGRRINVEAQLFTRSATSSPTISAHRCPRRCFRRGRFRLFVEGVKIGSGSCDASCNPAGSLMPQSSAIA